MASDYFTVLSTVMPTTGLMPPISSLVTMAQLPTAGPVLLDHSTQMHMEIREQEVDTVAVAVADTARDPSLEDSETVSGVMGNTC